MPEPPLPVHTAAALLEPEGVCHVFFAYDLGAGIDLDAAERILSAASGSAVEGLQRETIAHHRRAPSHLQFRPLPLRVEQASPPITLQRVGTESAVECTLFDFGAVSVQYRIRFNASLDGLVSLAAALYENKELLEDSRRRADALAARLAGAVLRPEPCALVEDYVVYQLRRRPSVPGEPIGPAFLGALRRDIAQVLRAERAALSEQEIADALTCTIAYGERDLTVVDWSAAVVIDPQAEDILAVLEFANVELLELRHLDDRLDAILDRSYGSVLRRSGERPRGRFQYGSDSGDRRRVAALQLDSALLFEAVNNALKLVGEQYLARLYRLASSRFHLADWDASIQRKLATLESLYEKINDEQSVRRMEMLEIIIIVLFVVSIVLPFLTPSK